MLRGPKLYPTVATYWVDDVRLTGQTRQDYLDICRRLQNRVGKNRRFAEITPQDVADYVDVGHSGGPRADRTRAHLLGVVWQVFDWGTDPASGERCRTRLGPLVTSNPASRLRALARRNRRAPRDVNRKTWLTKDWAKVLIATTRAAGRVIDRRDAVLIALYLYTGLRVSELIRVRWDDVDFAAGPYGGIHVIRKGGKPALVLLNEAARRELFTWRAAFVEAVGEDIGGLRIIPQTRSLLIGPPTAGLEPCTNGFRTTPGKRKEADRHGTCPACGKTVRITLAGTLWAHGIRRQTAAQTRQLVICWDRGITATVSVRAIVAARAQTAGITHLRPHDLRRSYAGILEDEGADLRDIQAGLGHAQMATTERYLKQRTKLAKAAEGIDYG